MMDEHAPFSRSNPRSNSLFFRASQMSINSTWMISGWSPVLMMRRKRWTEHLIIFNTVFPDCLSFDGKGFTARADGIRHEHVHEDVKAAFMFYNVHAYTKFVFHQRDRRASSFRARRYLISGPVFRIHFRTIPYASCRVSTSGLLRSSYVIYRMATYHVSRNGLLVQCRPTTMSAVPFQ